jgi:hypothetical protein
LRFSRVTDQDPRPTSTHMVVMVEAVDVATEEAVFVVTRMEDAMVAQIHLSGPSTSFVARRATLSCAATRISTGTSPTD